MYKVAEDLKYALSNEQAFFAPYNQGRSAKALAEIGYKSSEVLSAWLDHLLRKLKEDKSTKYAEPPTFEHQVYGSMKNLDAREYIYQGFQDSQEF